MLKRLAALVTALSLLSLLPATAQPVVGMVSLGYQQMSSLAAATALPSIPSGAIEAMIICTGQTVYWRDDGTNPTTTVGMPLPINVPYPYIGSLPKMRIIQTTASAVCNVTYYGY